MLKGGYYRYDLNSNISVLSINTIYFNTANTEDFDGAHEMIQWMNETLANSTNPQRKFIIMMHIFQVCST